LFAAKIEISIMSQFLTAYETDEVVSAKNYISK